MADTSERQQMGYPELNPNSNSTSTTGQSNFGGQSNIGQQAQGVANNVRNSKVRAHNHNINPDSETCPEKCCLQWQELW